MTDNSKATPHILDCLPSCMMPDGADPCSGYHHLHNMYDALVAERDRLRQQVEGLEADASNDHKKYLALKHDYDRRALDIATDALRQLETEHGGD